VLLGLLLGKLLELGFLLGGFFEGLEWVSWTKLLIFVLLERHLLWIDLALSNGLVVHFLLLGVNEESVLELLLGGLHRLPGLNGIVFLIVLVVKSVLNALLHLLLWSWLWELATSVLLGPLDGLLGIGDLFLIVLEDSWLLSSLSLLELLLWSQVLHFDLGLSERSVDWVGLDHGNSWHWVIVGWKGNHGVIANRGGLGEGLAILVKLQFIVIVESGAHGVVVGFHCFAHLLLGLGDAFLGYFILGEVLIPVLVVALKELNVRFTMLISIELFSGCVANQQQHGKTKC